MTFVPKIILEKSVDKLYAAVGESIIYTIKVINNDTLVFNHVIVYDTLDEALAFTKGSIEIDGVSMPEENIFAGIQLGSLSPNDIRIISFKVKVTKTDKKTAINNTTAQFNYQLLGGVVQEAEITSNPVTVQLFNADIQVIKTVDKEEAKIGDRLTYTVTIKNIGDVTIHSVLFKDDLPKQTRLISRSVRVNGNAVNGIEIEKGILLGAIDVRKEVIITYQVEVIGTNMCSTVVQSANVTFKYELPDGSIGERIRKSVSTPAYTQVAISTFKQLSVESYLTIPEVKPDIEAINNVSGTIDILDCHVIRTPKVTSTEGQSLTGYKLIIHGQLNISIEYTALVETQNVHSAHYTVPFSTFIILPSDYAVGSRFEIIGLAEDIYYYISDIRNFFINTTALINVKILSC